MEQNQISHELNGYKFSFNRVNPYLTQTHHDSTEPYCENHQVGSIASGNLLKQPQKQFSSLKSKALKDGSKPSGNPIPTSNGVFRNTKQMLYKKSQSDKNKVLMDLYLRKTRFNNHKVISSQPGKVQKPKLQPLSNHLNDPQKISSKSLIDPNNNNSTCPPIIDISTLTQTKQLQYDQNQWQNYVDEREEMSLIMLNTEGSEIEDHIPIIVTSRATSAFKIQQEQSVMQNTTTKHQQSTTSKVQQNRTTKKQMQSSITSLTRLQYPPQVNPLSNKKHISSKINKKKSRNSQYKILRNFSDHKFSAYIVSSPKNKPHKSGTAPITVETKTEKSKSLLKLYPQTFDINPMLTIQVTSYKKPLKHPHLKTKTQNSEQLQIESKISQKNLRINLTTLNSPQNSNRLSPGNNKKLQPLKLQSIKMANQQLSGRKHMGLMGQIKYKSPRMILSSRNQLFKGKNEGPKIKLFTQEQEGKIIKEFYSQENEQEKVARK